MLIRFLPRGSRNDDVEMGDAIHGTISGCTGNSLNDVYHPIDIGIVEYYGDECVPIILNSISFEERLRCEIHTVVGINRLPSLNDQNNVRSCVEYHIYH